MTVGTFSGDPKAIWLTEAGISDRHMRLLEEFWFEDAHKERWTAPAGYVTDGASIPAALWSLVGSPFTGDYRRAAIVHDIACDKAQNDVVKRRAADRMFFDACRAGGCSWWQAALLYIGVRIGAAIGSVEIWRQSESAVLPRLARTRADDALEQDFRAAAERVLQQGETDSAAEIENRADAALTQLTGVAFNLL